MATAALRRAVLAVVVVALAGCSPDSDEPVADRSATPSPSHTSPSPTPTPLIDPCLIGRWRQTEMTQETFVEATRVTTTGWTGRVLEFRPDGAEIVSYDQATPLEADGPAGRSVQTWRGTAIYRVRTSGDTLTFTSVDFSDTVVTWSYGGEEGTFHPNDLSPPVTYTCDETRHTQRNDRYEAVFVRLP